MFSIVSIALKIVVEEAAEVAKVTLALHVH